MESNLQFPNFENKLEVIYKAIVEQWGYSKDEEKDFHNSIDNFQLLELHQHQINPNDCIGICVDEKNEIQSVVILCLSLDLLKGSEQLLCHSCHFDYFHKNKGMTKRSFHIIHFYLIII
jgi:hypothetical protein